MEREGSPEIVGREDAQEVGGGSGEAAEARSGAPVASLGGSEDAFDRRPPGGDEAVAHPLPMRQGGLVLVRAMHDAVLDAGALQRPAALLVLICLVGAATVRLCPDAAVTAVWR